MWLLFYITRFYLLAYSLTLGATPLLRASYAGSYDSCEALLKAGANVNMSDSSFRDGRTPLHKAASNGHDDVMVSLSFIIT